MLNHSYLVAELTWLEVKTYLAQDYLAVLPIGAACKEHGLHLPLNTDYLQAEWLAQQSGRFHPVLIWPVLPYGYYPAFSDYPGSCSISEKAFTRTVADILQNILAAGANKILILNTGISTMKPLENVLDGLNQHDQIDLFNAYAGIHFTRAVNEIEEQPFGGHADEIETSIMLTIAPDKVDMSKAESFEGKLSAGPLNPYDPDKPNYSPHGVIGNATLATVEKGRRLTDAILADLAEKLGSDLSQPVRD